MDQQSRSQLASPHIASTKALRAGSSVVGPAVLACSTAQRCTCCAADFASAQRDALCTLHSDMHSRGVIQHWADASAQGFTTAT